MAKVLPHTADGRKVKAWVICAKCKGMRHRVLPGEITPYWWCQDNRISLQEGQEIEVESVEDNEHYLLAG